MFLSTLPTSVETVYWVQNCGPQRVIHTWTGNFRSTFITKFKCSRTFRDSITDRVYTAGLMRKHSLILMTIEYKRCYAPSWVRTTALNYKGLYDSSPLQGSFSRLNLIWWSKNDFMKIILKKKKREKERENLVIMEGVKIWFKNYYALTSFMWFP